MPRLPQNHPANQQPATPDQKNFILKHKLAPVPVVLRLTYLEAQQLMSGSKVLLAPEPPVPNRPKKQVPAEPLVEGGFYLLGTRVFRLYKGSSGRLYAKELIELAVPEEASNGVRRFRWEYARGVINSIRPEHRMTKAQAEAFGQHFSTCVRCGIALDPTITDRHGSRRYIGPKCQAKLGW